MKITIKFITGLLLLAFATVSMASAFPDLLAHMGGTKHAAHAPKPHDIPRLDLPAAQDFRACPQHFASGKWPVNSASTHHVALCFTGFAVMYNGTTKTAIYSAERLNSQRLSDAAHETRTDVFFEDLRLPRNYLATLDDYRGSFLDRGHLSPAGDQASAQEMAESFSLANIVPQAPENNRKAWAGIEKATRAYVRRAQGDVYVITGPAYQGGCTLGELARPPRIADTKACTIGQGGVAVPTHLWKLVFDPATGRAWAHWLANTDAARVTEPISYEELTARIGIELLPGQRPKR